MTRVSRAWAWRFKDSVPRENVVGRIDAAEAPLSDHGAALNPGQRVSQGNAATPSYLKACRSCAGTGVARTSTRYWVLCSGCAGEGTR